jgi:hypothetical protein
MAGTTVVSGSRVHSEYSWVEIGDADGTSAQATGTATVADAPLVGERVGDSSSPVATTSAFLGR